MLQCAEIWLAFLAMDMVFHHVSMSEVGTFLLRISLKYWGLTGPSRDGEASYTNYILGQELWFKLWFSETNLSGRISMFCSEDFVLFLFVLSAGKYMGSWGSERLIIFNSLQHQTHTIPTCQYPPHFLSEGALLLDGLSHYTVEMV